MPIKSLTFFIVLLALLTGLAGPHGPAGLGAGFALAASQAEPEEAPPPLEDPRQIVKILQRAIDERDAALVDERVDFNKVGVVFLDSSMPQINERITSGQLKLPQPLPSLLGSLNATSASTRRPTQLFLSAELRKFVLYGVASGYFAGKPRPQSELVKLDGGLFVNAVEMKPSRKKFGPAILASQDNSSATILTSLSDAASGRTYELELMLVREDYYWVVFSIENAVELFEQSMERD